MGNDNMNSGSQLRAIGYSDSILDSVVSASEIEPKKNFGQTDSEWIDMLFDGVDKGKHGVVLDGMKKRKTMESTSIMSRHSTPQPTHATTPKKRRRGRPRKFNIQEDETYSQVSVEIPEPELFEYSPYTMDQTTDEDLNLVLDLLKGGDNEDEREADHALSTKQTSIQEKRERSTDAKDGDDYDFSEENKTRSKWTEAELLRLWQGIARHGNNWTAIRGTCLGRSYCQIKDKGRRCLFLLGWETGRSKIETDSSSIHAKRIANEVLAELE